MQGRPSTAALVTGLVVIGALVLVVLLALPRSNPLALAEPTACPADSVTGRLDEVAGGQVCTVTNADTTDVTFGVTLRNEGRLPVRVTDLALQPLDVVGFTPQRIAEGEPPFRLASGETRRVMVSGQLSPCEARTTGGATTFTGLAFRVRTFGISRQAPVELDPAVRLVSEPCDPP